MMFIPRMWSSENERLELKKCTPLGYTLHGVGGLIGLVGLIILLVAPMVMIKAIFAGTFRLSHLGLVAVALGLGIVGWALDVLCWRLAARKGVLLRLHSGRGDLD